jgi:hypothetical protein
MLGGRVFRALLVDRNDPIVATLNAAGVKPMAVRKSQIFSENYVPVPAK